MKVQRLDNITPDTQATAFRHITMISRFGQNDDRDGSRVFVGVETSQNFKRAQAGQIEIEQDDLGRPVRLPVREVSLSENKVQRLRATACEMDAIGQADFFESAQGQLGFPDIVFDE